MQRAIRQLSPVLSRWPNAFQLSWGVMALIIASLALWLIWTLITPLSPFGAWRPKSAEIMAPPARLAMLESFDPFSRQVAATADPAAIAITALPIKLFGIRMNEGSGSGTAIIAGEDGVQKIVAMGQEIQPGVTLAGIAFDHVLINNGGKNEQLFLDQSKPATEVSGAAPATSAPPAAAAPAAPLTAEALRSGVAVTPRNQNGRITGLVVAANGDGAAFRAAGFLPGDIVTSINGQKVTGAEQAAALASQIKPGARLSVEVERGSQVVPIAIIVPGN